MKNINKLNRAIVLAVVSTSILSACGGSGMPAVTNAVTGGTQAPIIEPATGLVDAGNSYGDTLPQPLPPDQAPNQPLDTPEPLPAPSTPVQPGAPMILRAVSNTTAFAVPRFSKWFQVNGVYVHVHLTWQPVNGAAEYWIFKNRLPEFTEARRDTAHAIVKAGFATAGYKDGLEAPNLQSGSLWDRLKRAIGTMFNRPGETYTYKVIAADANGVPMSESPVQTSVPLPAISSATMDPADSGGNGSMAAMAPTANAPSVDVGTVNPLFTWKDAAQGTRPDGYYVTVFPSVQFTAETIPPTALAYWSTFRPTGTNVARYGEDVANLSSYKSTRPFDVTFDLQPTKAYSWTVVGIKTDTGDMKTANAISRSWSGFGHFKVAANAVVPPVSRVGAQNYGAYNAPRTTPYGQTTYPAQNTAYNQSSYGQSSYNQSSYGQQTGYGAQAPSSYNSSYGYNQQTAYPQQQQTSYGYTQQNRYPY